MSIRLFTIIILCITFKFSVLSQVTDDFSDGDFTNDPSWSGDLTDFVVNEDFKLQLKANAAGESIIYLPISIEAEQIWDFDIELDFAPSNDNRLEVYFHIDDTDLATASGYFFKIGESGSNDALVFYRLDNGIRTELARGIDGSLGNDPASVSIRIFKNQSFFEIYTSYDGSSCKEQEIIFSDPTYTEEQANYFLINCNYTSTRVDKFFFDNISIISNANDSEGPLATDVTLVNAKEIEIMFNEPLDILSAIDPAHYNINDMSIDAEEILIIGVCMDKVYINLTEPISSGMTNILSISGVQDQNGNAMSIKQNFDLILLESPEFGDLIITEILFNPYPQASDFIEIYNRSGKYLLLTDLILKNAAKDESKVIKDQIVMNPNSYLAFSEIPPQLWQQYEPPVEANIFEQDIPSFNDDSGNISIHYNEILLDSFDYSEDLHFDLIKDKEGVSLEKLDLERSSDSPSNWHSASSLVHYATPGYKNSQAENFNIESSMVIITNRIFSPDQDGFEDLLFVEFNLAKSGYLATIKIFDLRGYPIRILSNNVLVSNNGIIKWDGLKEDGQKASIGSYIIHIKLFHPDGTQHIFKKTCVVSGGFK